LIERQMLFKSTTKRSDELPRLKRRERGESEERERKMTLTS